MSLNQSLRHNLNLIKSILIILRSNKNFIFFILMSWIFSFVFFGIMIIFFILNLQFKDSIIFIDYVMFFLIYICIYFIINFFNTCLIHSIIKLMSKEDIQKNESIKFSFIIIKRIFFWTFFLSTFGLVLNLIYQFSKINYKFKKTMIKTMNYLIGGSWSIISILVHPIMVDKKSNPLNSLKKSINLIKKTWDINLTKNFRFGLIYYFVLVMFLIFIIIIIYILYILFGIEILFISISISILFLFGIITLYISINKTLQTLLYLYAEKNLCHESFKKNTLKKIFKKIKID